MNGEWVLVTEGSGLIGSDVVRQLLSLGYHVRVLDNLETGNLLYLDLSNPRLQFLYGDFTNSDDLRQAAAGVQGVFHCAAGSKADGNSDLLRAAKAAGLDGKVVYLVASAHLLIQRLPLEEIAPRAPLSLRCAAKRLLDTAQARDSLAPVWEESEVKAKCGRLFPAWDGMKARDRSARFRERYRADPAFDAIDVFSVSSVKLAINSHKVYTKTLNILIDSLLENKFTRFNDVIVFVGGSRSDSQPYLPAGRLGSLGILHVDTTLNAPDYNGLSGLFHHRRNPLLRARAYLYIHDTCTVGPTFPVKFDGLGRSVGRGELWIPPVPHSNIMAFGYGVILRYGTNYDHNLTKLEGIALEIGNTLEKYGQHPLSQIVDKKHQRELQPRIKRKRLRDIYGTGMPRTVFTYPEFDVVKYVMIGHHGDVQGHVKRMLPEHIYAALKKASTNLRPTYAPA